MVTRYVIPSVNISCIDCGLTRTGVPVPIYPPRFYRYLQIIPVERSTVECKSGAVNRTVRKHAPTAFHRSIRSGIVCFETSAVLFSLLHVHAFHFDKTIRFEVFVTKCLEDRIITVRVHEEGKGYRKKSYV